MKKNVIEFFHRGLIACGFGPIALAIVYLVLQQSTGVEILSVNQVCIGIFSISALEKYFSTIALILFSMLCSFC